MSKKTWYWNTKTAPAALRSMLRAVGEEHSVKEGAAGRSCLQFVPSEDSGACGVLVEGNTATISYGSPAQAARGLGTVLAGLPKKQITEATPFSSLGIMLDCSRNAVITVDHMRVWLRRLALLGYNMVMLYTEDTYQLPGEPYFGYQRGAYSKAELKAIVEYANKLNIEVIPCIQTLGHLEKILRHGAYNAVKDTSSVMLVGEEKTYALIEKMIRFWKSVCRTDRIHIGMDETHDLGRGRYLDRFGYRHGFDLFNEHLSRVVRICEGAGFHPIIWSDMYFRLGCESGTYYDRDTVIPKKVIKRIPKEAQLVYWDYYHSEKEFYLDWIQRHRDMGKEPLMGSGIWTWNKYWYDHRTTVANAGPCIEACREADVKEIFFTQWGDNGAYCDHDSAFAGMAYCADKAYGHENPGDRLLKRRFTAVCGGDYDAHLLAGEMHGGAVKNFHPSMWADPFFETPFRTSCKDNTRMMAQRAKAFGKLAGKLKKHAARKGAGDMRYGATTARAFADRFALIAALLAAYRKKDKAALKKAAAAIPQVRRSIRAMAKAFRTMWLSHNKPEGMETIQARFGMLDARYQEMATSIKEYLGGKVDTLAPWDCKCPPR